MMPSHDCNAKYKNSEMAGADGSAFQGLCRSNAATDSKYAGERGRNLCLSFGGGAEDESAQGFTPLGVSQTRGIGDRSQGRIVGLLSAGCTADGAGGKCLAVFGFLLCGGPGNATGLAAVARERTIVGETHRAATGGQSLASRESRGGGSALGTSSGVALIRPTIPQSKTQPAWLHNGLAQDSWYG